MSSGILDFGMFCCICFEQITYDTCSIDYMGIHWDTCRGECAVKSGVVEIDYEELTNED